MRCQRARKKTESGPGVKLPQKSELDPCDPIFCAFLQNFSIRTLRMIISDSQGRTYQGKGVRRFSLQTQMQEKIFHNVVR